MRSIPSLLLVLFLLSPSLCLGQAAPLQAGSPATVDQEALLKHAERCAAAFGAPRPQSQVPDTAGKKQNAGTVTAGADSSCGSGPGGAGAGLMDALAGSPEMMAQMAEMAARLSPVQAAQMQKLMAEVQTPDGSLGNGSEPVPAMLMSGIPRNSEQKGLELSSHLKEDLARGKTIIRNIEWTPGAGTVTPAGADKFDRGMAKVAAAMRQAGGSYRLDLYMDQQSGDIVVRTLGPQRLATVRAALVRQGEDAPQTGVSRKDSDPRLEVVKVK